MMTNDKNRRFGTVALLGAANAGKSTLTNLLVGEAVSPMTHKPHTTRTRISAIAIHNGAQIVCIDTPGLVQARSPLEKAMRVEAEIALQEVDLRLLLVDVSRPKRHAETTRLTKQLSELKKPSWLILNKIDKISRDKLLPLTAELTKDRTFAETFMISATKQSGTDKLKDALAAAMPERPWAYPEEQLTLQSQKFLAAEVTRAVAMQHLHQELPYTLAVETTDWREDREREQLVIDQTIYTSEESHKGMIIGKKGQTLKRIGSAARRELNDSLERRVHLNLFVKVRSRWDHDPELLMRLGFIGKSSA